jgi:hypothetical protein
MNTLVYFVTVLVKGWSKRKREENYGTLVQTNVCG